MISCSQGKNKKSNRLNDSNFELIHSLVDENGTKLGDVYVKYVADEVFDSLYILNLSEGNNDTLYSIIKTQLLNREGLDIKVYEKDFYGYKVVIAKPDYIVLNYLRKQGEYVSDNIKIYWNYRKGLFEVFKI